MARTRSTGLDALDADLGGLPAGSITQVYGPPASGKTTLALVVAKERAPSALVLPEKPLHERMEAVLDGAAGRTLVARPGAFEEQAEAVERASRLLDQGRVGFVGLDSLTFLYRFEKLSKTESLQQLFDQVRRMRDAARASGDLALFTNQVRGGDRGWTALGGPAIAHASDVILRLDVLEGPWRRLTVEKHPSRPSGHAYELRITGDGLR